MWRPVFVDVYGIVDVDGSIDVDVDGDVDVDADNVTGALSDCIGL